MNKPSTDLCKYVQSIEVYLGKKKTLMSELKRNSYENISSYQRSLSKQVATKDYGKAVE